VRKIQALSALIDLKVATKTETQELAALVSTAECSLVAQTSNLLTQLTDSKHVGANQIDPLRQKVIECLPVLPPTAAVTLIRERPELFASSCADVGMKIGTSIYAPAITAALIDLALSHDGCSLIAERTILHESRELKAETLLKLAQQQKISDGIVTAVYDGPLASEADADLFYSAALVMAKHAPNRVDWKHFIREAISAAGRDEPVRRFLDVTHYLEPSIVLDEVVPALDSDAPERVVGACHIGASLGSQAVPIVSKLWHLREKRNPSIRYAAALALLEINPLTPELQDMLRQLLVNRYLGWALGRPIKWQQTVALVELPKAEFGTLRTTNLERLLVSSTEESAEKP
jgi:hypothetical protein